MAELLIQCREPVNNPGFPAAYREWITSLGCGYNYYKIDSRKKVATVEQYQDLEDRLNGQIIHA